MSPSKEAVEAEVQPVVSADAVPAAWYAEANRQRNEAEAALRSALAEKVLVMDAAFEWIKQVPHDDHCFTNDPNDAGCRCVCGKESILDRIAELLSDEDAALAIQPEPATAEADADVELQRYIARCDELSTGGEYKWWSRLAEILRSQPAPAQAETAVPEGMALVPIKPTEAMKEAVRKNGGTQAVAWALAAWPDMLAASPISKGGQ